MEPFSRLHPDCQKTPGELERAAVLSKTNRARRRVRRVREDFCVGKSHFPEQKLFPCSFCSRKSERFQQKLEGVAVARELAPSSTCLSKSFLTSSLCKFRRGSFSGPAHRHPIQCRRFPLSRAVESLFRPQPKNGRSDERQMRPRRNDRFHALFRSVPASR